MFEPESIITDNIQLQKEHVTTPLNSLPSFLSEDEILERITELDDQVNSKETFQSLIQLLKTQQQVPSIDDDYSDYITLVREKYHDSCILSYSDYQSWIKDILQEGNMDELMRVYELMEIDYKNCDFYCDFLQFIISHSNELSDFDLTKIIKRARNNTKYDFINSRKVFTLLIQLQITFSTIDEIKALYEDQLSIPHLQLDITFQEFSSFISSNYPDIQYHNLITKGNKIYQQCLRSMDSYEEAWLFVKNQVIENANQWIELMRFIHTSTSKKQRHINRLLPALECSIVSHHDDSIVVVWLTFLNYAYEYSQYPMTFSTDYNLVINDLLKRFMRYYPTRLIPITEILKNFNRSIDSEFVCNLQSRWEMILSKYEDQRTEMNTYDDYHEWKNFHLAVLSDIWQLYQLSSGEEAKLEKELLTTCEEFFNKSIQSQWDPYHSIVDFICLIYQKLEKFDKVRECHKIMTGKFNTESNVWINWLNFEKRQVELNDSSVEILIKVINSALNNSATMVDGLDKLLEEITILLGLFGSNLNDFARLRGLNGKCWKCMKELERSRMSQQIIFEDSGDKKRSIYDSESIDEPVEKKKIKKSATIEKPHKNREANTVQVSNLSEDTTSDQIKQFFQDCGDIIEIHQSLNEATLLFETEYSVLRALTKDRKQFQGHEIRVEKLQGNIIWVANYPESYTKDQLVELFQDLENINNTIQSIRFPTLKTNTNRRFCYITYNNPQDAQAAVEKYHLKCIDGHELIVKISNPDERIKRNVEDQGKTVFIRNLDFYQMDEIKIRELFEPYGKIENVKIPIRSDINGKSKRVNNGFAFVKFSSDEQAESAVKGLDQHRFNGRYLNVSIAESKNKEHKKLELVEPNFDKLEHNNSTVLLKNVPDTFTNAELSSFIIKQIPELSKIPQQFQIQIQPKINSAIIDCDSAQVAGLISLRLEGVVVNDVNQENNNRILTIGDMKELPALEQQYVNNKNKNVTLMVPNRLQRRKLIREASRAVNIEDTQRKNETMADEISKNITPTSDVKKKSNADFRAMFLSSFTKK